jgi:hypothetical protein
VSKDGYLIADECVLIDTGFGVRCLVQQGDTITLDLATGCDIAVARFFALSAGIGTLLHQRGLIPLHAAAIQTSKGCVAFCGNAGDGKSTLAASLANAGYKLYTDDRLTVHETAQHRYLAVPSVPVAHLLEDSPGLSGIGSGNLAHQSYRFGKHVHLLQSSYAMQAAPLVGLYFTDWLQDPDAAPQIIPMNQLDAMMRLRRDVALAHLVELLGNEQRFLTWAAELCATRPSFHLLRPKNRQRHNECLDLIISHVEDTFGE